MNPRARAFKRKRCYICGFPYSDEHHVYPQSLGGIPVVFLCPNHHRMANMLQGLIIDGLMVGDSMKFIRQRQSTLFGFDRAFCALIPALVDEYRAEECRCNDRILRSKYAVEEKGYLSKAVRLGSQSIWHRCFKYRLPSPDSDT